MTSTPKLKQPKPSAAHKRLEAFIGTWNAEGTSYGGETQDAADPRAAGVPWISDESYEWLPGGFFVLHRWDAQSFKGAEIMGYDESEGGYFTRMFDNAGHHPDYRANVDGNVWSFTEAQSRATVTVDEGGNEMTFNWEWKNGGRKWLPLCDRVAVRTPRATRSHTTRISQVATVFVPVADQHRSLAFYIDKLGFEKRADFAYGDDSRWIEVAPPGSTIAIALVPSSEGQSNRGDEAHCAFTTQDIQADHATLRAHGVDVDAVIARKGKTRSGLISVKVKVPDPVPPQFFFRDIDGNRFLLVQPA